MAPVMVIAERVIDRAIREARGAITQMIAGPSLGFQENPAMEHL